MNNRNGAENGGRSGRGERRGWRYRDDNGGLGAGRGGRPRGGGMGRCRGGGRLRDRDRAGESGWCLHDEIIALRDEVKALKEQLSKQE
ncbi:MAG: hypothetical protein P8Z49_08675 [Acidobacteriota bacterium]|jgi:hypothetical protein